MTRHQYLHHVTLTTGHVRRSARSEVDDGVVDTCAALLRDAISGGEPLLPAIDPPVTMTATAEGRCVAVTIWAADESRGRAPLLTIGIAAKSRCGAPLWRLLHQHAHPAIPIKTKAEECPPEPWCAGRIDPGGALYPDARAMWMALADLERCLAWAWIERATYCELCERRVIAIDDGGDLLCPTCALVL